MAGAKRLALFLAFLACGSHAGPASLVQFEGLSADMRVIIGVPSDSTYKDGRGKAKRERIKSIVAEHVANDTMWDTLRASDVQVPSKMEYAFLEDSDSGFGTLFPKHVGDDGMPPPAIRLMNARSGDFMSPDWKIQVSDFEGELNRLVAEFLKWQAQTTDVDTDADGLMVLHSKNMDQAQQFHDPLLTLFYAPWCHFSKKMLPKVAEAQRLLASLDKRVSLPPGIGIGKVDVDAEGTLRADHNISVYPTLKTLSRTKSDAFRGSTESPASIVSHLVLEATGPASLDAPEDAVDAAQIIIELDALLKAGAADIDPDERTSDGAPGMNVVLVQSGGDKTQGSVAAIEGLHGRTVFVVESAKMDLSRTLLARLVSAGILLEEPTLEDDSVSVVSTENGFVSHPLASSQRQLQQWTLGAIWPTVSRFDGSAAQGDRIRGSPIDSLMLLVADEADFMFPEFKKALESVAAQHRGEAHFLFAPESEQRIQGILNAGRVQSAPAVVFLSLTGEFEPTSLSAKDITEEGLGGLLERGSAGHREL